jgi:uncharacterized protein with ParB-like and HNH nuclease domain
MAEPKGAIVSEHIGIGTALTRNLLVVPVNQREYAWERKHVTDLLQDLSKAISANKSTYFLGTVVLTVGKDEVWEVADGQQRLATTTILLAAIRDYYFSNPEDKLLVTNIESKYLLDIDPEQRKIVPRLTLNVQDNEFFRKRIILSPDDKGRKISPVHESHRRIDEAAKLIAKHVQDLIKPLKEKDRSNYLNRWVKFLDASAKVVVLKVPDDLNAYVMFETLNDRGLKTSQSDLLKNYLFGEADDRLKEAQEKWAAMNGILEALGVDDIVITYLRHLAISLYGHTREKDLFETIKRRISGEGPAVDFLDALSDRATDYAAILNPNHSKWNSFTDSVRNSLRTIDTLRVILPRPLMLSIVQKFSDKEVEKAFRLIISWSVRFLIVGGGRSGSVEEAYAKLASSVTAETISTTKQLATAMEEFVPTDAEFEAGFSGARVSQNYLARYYLRALELKIKDNPEPEWVPNENTVINLEHILPEAPNGNWPNVDPEMAAACYKRIGNMVLLQATKNTLIGNSKFADKKPTLKASTFILTTQVAGNADWGPKEIAARQVELAKLAVRTWPLAVR